MMSCPGMLQKKQWLSLSIARCFFIVFLSFMASGCTLRMVGTPQLTGTWEGIACVVDVIDENNQVHQVVGIEITKAVSMGTFYQYGSGPISHESWTAKEQEEANKKLDKKQWYGYSEDTYNKPLLMKDKHILVLPSQVDYIGKTVRLKGLLKLNGKGPFMPTGKKLPAHPLSQAIDFVERDGSIRKQYSSGAEVVFIGTVEPVPGLTPDTISGSDNKESLYE